MARPTLTAEQRRQMRRKIRVAAAALYTEGGHSGITVRAVAEKAGVSVGAVYSHFKNLSELMQSLWRRPAGHMVLELTELSAAVADPEERLARMLQAYVDFATSNPGVFRNAFLYVRPEHHEQPPQVRLEDDEFFCCFRKAITDGQASGVFRSGDADTLTQAVLSSVHGSLAMPINLHRLALKPGTEIADFLIHTMLDWLKSNSTP